MRNWIVRVGIGKLRKKATYTLTWVSMLHLFESEMFFFFKLTTKNISDIFFCKLKTFESSLFVNCNNDINFIFLFKMKIAIESLEYLKLSKPHLVINSLFLQLFNFFNFLTVCGQWTSITIFINTIC